MLKLREYQREDIEELKSQLALKRRHILGSDPGVGKTTEVLHVCKELDFASVLVICPKTLIPEWEFQIEDWLGTEYLDYFTFLNYEKLRNPFLINTLMREDFDLVCFDECHKLKNSKAKQTMGAFLVMSNPNLKSIMMSGSPMQNGPQDLYSLFHIIEPQTYKLYSEFEKRFCAVQRLPKPPFPKIIVGPRNVKELRELLHRHMLRREAKDVMPWVKDPIWHTIPVQLEGRQLAQYRQMEDELFVLLDSGEKVTAPAVTAQIIRLRQLCLEPNLLSSVDKRSTPSAKTRLILDMIDGLDGPVILFSYFKQYIRILKDELARAKVPYMSITGDESPTEKAAVIKAAHEHKLPKMLLGTITSMSLGLNLEASHHVIFTDWWYNPEVNNQAWRRLQRFNQKHIVEIHDLWARGTAEDAIHRVDRRKRAWISQVVANTQMVEELRAIRRTR